MAGQSDPSKIRPGQMMRLRRIVAGIAGVGLIAAAFWYATEIAPARDLVRMDPNAIPSRADMMRFAASRGERVFRGACVSCHGPQGAGDPRLGVPNLTDNDWLYGAGTPAEIERVITYGIRSRHPKAWNLSAMPAYARPVPLQGQDIPTLSPDEIADLVAYVAGLSKPGNDAAIARGAELFRDKAGCFDCHAEDARGDSGVGAPNLADAIWLYGDGSPVSIAQSISYGRQGVCPSHEDRLSPAQAREAALFVYALSHRDPAGKAE
jgi:cytochrome c oxidase cbb3-type subunit 3